MKTKFIKRCRPLLPVIILLTFESGCDLDRYSAERFCNQSVFPSSSELLRGEGLETLKYQQQRRELKIGLRRREVLYTWTDTWFIEDAKATLHYRYSLQILNDKGTKELCLFSVEFDVSIPVDTMGRKLLLAFIHGVERGMGVNLDVMRSKLERCDFHLNPDSTITLASPVPFELAYINIPSRGPALSLEIFKDTSFLRR